jgi:hypothetical protein
MTQRVAVAVPHLDTRDLDSGRVLSWYRPPAGGFTARRDLLSAATPNAPGPSHSGWGLLPGGTPPPGQGCRPGCGHRITVPATFGAFAYDGPSLMRPRSLTRNTRFGYCWRWSLRGFLSQSAALPKAGNGPSPGHQVPDLTAQPHAAIIEVECVECWPQSSPLSSSPTVGRLRRRAPAGSRRRPHGWPAARRRTTAAPIRCRPMRAAHGANRRNSRSRLPATQRSRQRHPFRSSPPPYIRRMR